MRVIAAGPYTLGEGPCWSNGWLWWVDIIGRRILRAPFDGDTLGAISEIITAEPVGFVAVATDGIVAGIGLGLWRVTADGVDGIAHTGHLAPGPTRVNDGAVDPRGRVFAGVMGSDAQPGWGALYRFDADRVRRVVDAMTIPNGLGWNPAASVMYVTDSGRRAIDAYDYDLATGDLGERRSFVELAPSAGVPDGLCVDADGCVWSAIWGAGQVRRYRPDGSLDRVLEVPARQPSACAFAGPDLDRLVITTATEGLETPGGADGAVFVTSPGVRGLGVDSPVAINHT